MTRDALTVVHQEVHQRATGGVAVQIEVLLEDRKVGTGGDPVQTGDLQEMTEDLQEMIGVLEEMIGVRTDGPGEGEMKAAQGRLLLLREEEGLTIDVDLLVETHVIEEGHHLREGQMVVVAGKPFIVFFYMFKISFAIVQIN